MDRLRVPELLRTQARARLGFAPRRVASPSAGPQPRILTPGRTLWRLEQASRVAFLVDADAYFRALERCFRCARRSIWILGWDFNPEIDLLHGRDGLGTALGGLLRSLVEQRPELEIRLLIWQLGALYSQSRLNRSLTEGWSDHPRIRVRLDGKHPLRASHHQKLVCVDDAVAFAGGIDLTVRRWDTPDHRADDPARLDPYGTPYPPVHDIQMAVEGDAARALGDLARQRWQTATGEEHRPVPASSPCWPPELPPDLVDIEVAIARTRPPHSGRATRREVALLNRAALTGARRSIYIETQYFASAAVGRILARRLREPEGPDVVIVVTASSRALIERWVMGANRNRLIRRLRRADRWGRLRVMYAAVPAADGAEREVLIHSKLVIVDDRFLRIGSSNLNNRSEGLDTECDLAIEARNEAESRTIAALRERLLAEHLATTPETVRAIVSRTRSLLQAVDWLNTQPRGLRRLRTGPGATELLIGTGLLDPRRPWWPLQELFRPIVRWMKTIRGSF